MAKKPPAPFTSMQILSSRAQSLWKKAKTHSRTADKPEVKRRNSLPPPEKHQTLKIVIASRTVAMSTLTVLGVLLAAWVLMILHDKLLLIILAFFLSIIIDSSVRFLERHHVPRGIAVLLMYLLFLSLVVFLVVSMVPILATELQNLAEFLNAQRANFLQNPQIHLPLLSADLNADLTELVKDIVTNLNIQDKAGTLLRFSETLATLAKNSGALAVSVAGSVFNFMASLIFILVLTFFIQLEREKIIDLLRLSLPLRYRGYFDDKAETIYTRMSQWFQGQLLLCLCIGILVFIALTILGMPYALTLALLAGFTEFIPYLGPLIAAVPAVLIALSQYGFVLALVTAIVYYVIQACENNLLVPLIMKQAVGLSPILIMAGMLVGISFPDTIHPVLGIILSVPLTSIIAIFVQDLIDYRRHQP